MSEGSFDRRLRRTFTRYQARFESGTGERWIPFVLAGALAAGLAWLGLSRLWALDAGTDLAGYSQGVWLISEGIRPEATLFRGIHLLEINWAFVLYPLALLVQWLPAAPVLVVVQSLALGLALVPLALLARRVADLRLGATTAVLGAYAFHPATHELAVGGFHPEALAVPGIIGFAYFGARRRWLPYWACVLFVLLCRADLGLAVALWGFVLVGEGNRRVGLATMGIASSWALGLLLVVQPIAGADVIAAGQYGSYGDSLGEALLTIARNPLDFLGDLTSRSNTELLVGLLAPVLFLPVLAPRYLLPAVPLTALYLVVAGSPGSAGTEQSSLFLAFLLIATVHGLRRLGTRGVDRVFVDGPLITALLTASVLTYLWLSPASLYERPWSWRTRDAADEAVLEAITLLDPDDAVRTSPSGVNELAERRFVRVLPTDQAPSLAVFNADARAVLVVEAEIPERTRAQRVAFDEQMLLFGYELRFDDADAGVQLYYRP